MAVGTPSVLDHFCLLHVELNLLLLCLPDLLGLGYLLLGECLQHELYRDLLEGVLILSEEEHLLLCLLRDLRVISSILNELNPSLVVTMSVFILVKVT